MSDSEIPLDIAGHEDREGDRREPSARGGGAAADRERPSAASPDEPGPLDEDGPEDPEGPEGDAEEEVEPVEVLVQLARDGEIDPWDIDIVAVTDKFLDALDEADLRTSGRALFYASVLLRMKGDAMLAPDDEEPDDEPEPWELAMNGDAPVEDPDPFAKLEAEMDRRLDRRRARGMPQTLDELVRDLREAERDNWWKEHREYDTSDSPHGYARGAQELDYRTSDDLRMDEEPTAADVTGTAHGEHIDDIIDAVWAKLREQYEQGRDEVLFAEVEGAGGSRVETFLGVLFLSHRGQVALQQDQLFGDLWIQDPTAVGGSEEAIAD